MGYLRLVRIFPFFGADQQLKNHCLAAFQCPFHLSIR